MEAIPPGKSDKGKRPSDSGDPSGDGGGGDLDDPGEILQIQLTLPIESLINFLVMNPRCLVEKEIK